MLQIFLLHRGHFRRGKRTQTIVGRMNGGDFRMAFGLDARDDQIGFGTTLRRRIRCLNPAVTQITMLWLESSTGRGGRLPAVKDILVHLGCRAAGWSFNSCIQIGLDTFFTTRSGSRGGRPAALDLFASPWPVLVVGMFLQVNHTQSLGFFDVRTSILRS